MPHGDGVSDSQVADVLTLKKEFADAFGRFITTKTRNLIDIPSNYEFNAERLRLFLNDARTHPDDAGTKFSDREGDYLLKPAGGEKMELHSAERPRYIVGYESAASLATKVETSLGSGDTLKVGMRDRQNPENAAFFEINGGSDNRLVLVDEGTEKKSETFTFPDGVNEESPVRWEIQFNWYSVGRFLFTAAFTDSSNEVGEKQEMENIGELAVDDDWSISDAAMHVFAEIDASTSTPEVGVGSFGFITLGGVEASSRPKTSRLTGLSYGGSGDYEALAAIRLFQPLGNVFMDITDVMVFPDGGSGELAVIVFPEGDTDATSFSVPPEQSAENSVLRETTSVSQFVDSEGTTVTSTADPGGYQVGFAAFESAGSGNNRIFSMFPQDYKRPIYETDNALFLYKADTATARSVNVNYTVEQKW